MAIFGISIGVGDELVHSSVNTWALLTIVILLWATRGNIICLMADVDWSIRTVNIISFGCYTSGILLALMFLPEAGEVGGPYYWLGRRVLTPTAAVFTAILLWLAAGKAKLPNYQFSVIWRMGGLFTCTFLAVGFQNIRTVIGLILTLIACLGVVFFSILTVLIPFFLGRRMQDL